MAKKNSLGITVKKEENISEWYSQIITKAKLADYSPIKGCMVIRENGMMIWESIQNYFNDRMSKLGVKNHYFPLFIPESFFQKEAEHAEGFSPEVAWIESKEDTKEKLAIRPTSETIICEMFKEWLRSHRDLPILTNQWANVVRWEVKQTNPFLRSREFLWQEGHCIFKTKEEADKNSHSMSLEYKKLSEEVLAMPVIWGKKTDDDKFAGADYTYTIEGIMPDGKALQAGTSHMLGTGFMSAFGVEYVGVDEKKHNPFYTSWGFSTRLIGGVIMTHGDDKGMVMPPRLAKNKVVIVPILFKGKEEIVLSKVDEIKKTLPDDWNVIVDDREDMSPGFKLSEWELCGIPIRIEIGPRDVENGNVVITRRDLGEKNEISIEKTKKYLKEQLEQMQNDMYNKALERSKKQIVNVSNYEDFNKAIENKCIVRVPWDGTTESELTISDKTGTGSRCVDQDETPENGETCIESGKQATAYCYFGRSY